MTQNAAVGLYKHRHNKHYCDIPAISLLAQLYDIESHFTQEMPISTWNCSECFFLSCNNSSGLGNAAKINNRIM